VGCECARARVRARACVRAHSCVHSIVRRAGPFQLSVHPHLQFGAQLLELGEQLLP